MLYLWENIGVTCTLFLWSLQALGHSWYLMRVNKTLDITVNIIHTL